MNKEQVIKFIDNYSPIFNGEVNEVINDVKTRIIDRIDSYDDNLTTQDIDGVEWDLLNEEWLIYYNDILDYYKNNRVDIEELIDPTDVWESMKYRPHASIFEAIQYAINSAHAIMIANIIAEVRELYA